MEIPIRIHNNEIEYNDNTTDKENSPELLENLNSISNK